MSKFKMKISMNALNHLGIKLYSNTPAVLSEVIANSWDAGAENVRIFIGEDVMSIHDDGIGMSQNDLNAKFLVVGYQKRKNQETLSPKYNRKVMGRKGIGKLSLLSIAHIVEVHTCKDGKKSGFTMNLKDIQATFEDKEESIYVPKEIDEHLIKISSDGTLIILKDFKKNINRTSEYLRPRLARRFGVYQTTHNFNIFINNHIINVSDRSYFNKLQAIWEFGEKEYFYKQFCDQEKINNNFELLSPLIKDIPAYRVSGWIGTVENSGHLKDGSETLNKIPVLVRGKVALEDILSEYPETGLFAKYLIGEIYADFLDEDDQEDIATSSRQDFLKDDERFQLLKTFIQLQLRHIRTQWDTLRDREGVAKATEIPAINNWFKTLQGDTKRKAIKLFGKINQTVSDNIEHRKILFQQSVLAFEYFKQRDELEKLHTVDPENIPAVLGVFSTLDSIEATLYYKIVSQRLEVISALETKIKDNSLEKTIQYFLYEHLWLLDPSWERAAGSEQIEKSFQDALNAAKLSEDEKRSRMDIKYKTSSGLHIIIELKKPDVSISTYDLIKQVDKYQTALEKVLLSSNETSNIKAVCILGKYPTEFSATPKAAERARTTLEDANIKVLLYSELLNNARKGYTEYIASTKDLGKLQEIIKAIESSSFD